MLALSGTWYPRMAGQNLSICPFSFEGKNLNTEEIVIAIDAEITLLQQARNLLADEKPRKRHTMSAETRAKIAASQKNSWAKRRKTR